MDFQAEIIRTSQRKLASNDNQYEILLRTDNPMILDLGKLPSDSMFQIAITLYDNTGKPTSQQLAEIARGDEYSAI
jgi:hypothetical protein